MHAMGAISIVNAMKQENQVSVLICCSVSNYRDLHLEQGIDINIWRSWFRANNGGST